MLILDRPDGYAVRRCPNCKRMQPRTADGLSAWEPIGIRGATVDVCSSCASNLFAHTGLAKAGRQPSNAPTIVSESLDIEVRWYGKARKARYCGPPGNGSCYPHYLVDGTHQKRWLVFVVGDRVHSLFDGKGIEWSAPNIDRYLWADNIAAYEAKRWIAACALASASTLRRSQSLDDIRRADVCEALARKFVGPSIADRVRESTT